MKEFKGTKGEWIITEPENSNGFIYIGRYRNDSRIATCYTVGFENHKGGITEETRANAKLISAAPELLEALMEVLSMTNLSIKYPNSKSKTLDEAEELGIKAINKALGL